GSDRGRGGDGPRLLHGHDRHPGLLALLLPELAVGGRRLVRRALGALPRRQRQDPEPADPRRPRRPRPDQPGLGVLPGAAPARRADRSPDPAAPAARAARAEAAPYLPGLDLPLGREVHAGPLIPLAAERPRDVLRSS